MLRTQSLMRNIVIVLTLLMATLSCAIITYAANLDSEEQAFVTLINNYRQQNGLQPLKVSDKIDAAAEWMSNDMATKNYFSHTDSLGRDPFQRMSAFGYTYSTAKGENIAAGNATASATFTQWKNSPGHNANMLNGNYRVMGIARVYSPGSTYHYYWTNDFGGYDDTGSTTPTPTPGDTTAPTVAITSPADGATVSGSITVSVSATDNVGVSKVTLQANGITSTDTTAPYSFTVNTTSMANGSVSFTATASDAAGNTTAKTITVTVNNTSTIPIGTIPAVPTGLRALVQVPNVVVSWSPGSGGGAPTSYRLQTMSYSSTLGKMVTQTTTVASTVTSKTFAPSSTSTFYARICAANAYGASAYTPWVRASR